MALGTGLMIPQFFPLARRGFLQNTGRQTPGGGRGHFFHLRKINVQSRTLVAKALSNNDFSPLLGQMRNRLQLFGCELPRSHDIVILDFRKILLG